MTAPCGLLLLITWQLGSKGEVLERSQGTDLPLEWTVLLPPYYMHRGTYEVPSHSRGGAKDLIY